MSPPTLITPVIKDVIQELLKSNKSDKHDNFEPITKLILSSRNGFDAFLEFVQEQVPSASLQREKIVVKFNKGGVLRAEYLPLGLWKEIAPFIFELSINKFDKDNDVPLIKAFQHSTNLQKVDVKHQNLGIESWQHLLSSSVKNICATMEDIAIINELEGLNTNLEHVGMLTKLHYADDDTNSFAFFKNLFSNFKIKCKSLKIHWGFGLKMFVDCILPAQVISTAVENLEISSSFVFETLLFWEEFDLKSLLEALQQMFPNLKKAKIVAGNKTFLNRFRAPDLEGVTTVINMLNNRMKDAEINYEVEFEHGMAVKFWSRLAEDVYQLFVEHHSVAQSFANNGLTMEEKTEYSEIWVYEKKVADGKNFKIAYKVIKLPIGYY